MLGPSRKSAVATSFLKRGTLDHSIENPSQCSSVSFSIANNLVDRWRIEVFNPPTNGISQQFFGKGPVKVSLPICSEDMTEFPGIRKPLPGHQLTGGVNRLTVLFITPET